jgi:ubiquinone/menaquinone biosynthesis C-methylase UbiE
MREASGSFDSLARWYRALEFLAFGRDLERARFCFIDRLGASRSILVLGEGDGRFLELLVRAAPGAAIHCVDSSAAMLALASARVPAGRVTFERADALTLDPAPSRYDAVVTLFFLDCFRAAQVEDLVRRVRSGLAPGALWLWADFSIPRRGPARWRAKAWVALLYSFFRLCTGLAAGDLPPVEETLARAGLRRESFRDFQWGLVRSAVYLAPERAATGAAAAGFESAR